MDAMAHRVLLVEDDERIRTSMRLSLEDEGYEVEEAGTGEEALELQTRALVSNPFDLLVVDIMLPGMDGFECCRELRKTSAVPIIMVTARTDTHDVVAGLEAGADDYVTKPFGPRELIARLQANLRRVAPEPEPAVITTGELEVDLASRTVRNCGAEVHLTPTEFDLLRLLVRNRGRLMTHRDLLVAVWGVGYGEDTQVLRAHIANLRRKIEPPGGPKYIRTDPGVGYRFAG
jgi:two-component system KDP operon response regulator KdpE